MWDRLRAYQQEGVRRGLQMGGTCLLSDEMGLGKTLTVRRARFKTGASPRAQAHSMRTMRCAVLAFLAGHAVGRVCCLAGASDRRRPPRVEEPSVT